MSKKFKLPFWMMPASWGLTGDSRTKAEIEYTYSGIERELKLAEFDHRNDESQCKKAILSIHLKHGLIDADDFAVEMAIVDTGKDSVSTKAAELKRKHNRKEISELEYDKEWHTLNKKPWVSILSTTVNESDPSQGAFELDWNEYFVSLLEEHQYIYKTPEDAVNAWLIDLCKNIAQDTYGDIITDPEVISTVTRRLR